MFYVGQKVVCVKPYRGYLEKGSTYTVSRVGLLATGLPGVNVSESDTSDCRHDVAFSSSRFRPVAERKTDISIFKAMLNPADKRVEA